MIPVDSRPGALVGQKVTGRTMAENRGLPAPQASHAFLAQNLARSQTLVSSTPQPILGDSIGPPGSTLHVTSSGRPSLTIHLQSGLAALALCSMAPLRFLYPLSFNCLSHCSEWLANSMRAGLLFISVTAMSPG